MQEDLTARRRDFLVFLLVVSAFGLLVVVASRLIVAPLGNLPIWPEVIGEDPSVSEGETPAPEPAVPEVRPPSSYKDDDFGFRLSYPADFRRSVAAFEGYLPVTGRAAFAVLLDHDEGTNLSEAAVIVGVSGDEQALEFCAADTGLGEPAGSVSFGGVTWDVFAGVEAAAGNLYDYRYYRTAARGRCYEIAEVIHSTNIGNYDPGAVREFDRDAVAPRLDAVARSFEFVE